MTFRNSTLLLSALVLITSCTVETQSQEKIPTDPSPTYEYQIGLGYGFLNTMVQVSIEDQEVLSMYGTQELEQYAQLLGTKMLASGTSPKKDITVRVIMDGGQPYRQSIDLSTGMYTDIYLEQTGLSIFHTQFLIEE